MIARDFRELFPSGFTLVGGYEKAIPVGTTLEFDSEYCKIEGRWRITRYYDEGKRFTAVSNNSSREFCADELVLSARNIELPNLCQTQ